MAWLAVNKKTGENLFLGEPKRNYEGDYEDNVNVGYNECYCTSIPVPDGTIQKLIGRTLTWEDKPVELT